MKTVISRWDQNTRPRDYYDIYILTKLQAENIDLETLEFALKSTAEKRASEAITSRYYEIMEVVCSSGVMNRQWENCQKDFSYAVEIEFKEICNAVVCIMEKSEAMEMKFRGEK